MDIEREQVLKALKRARDPRGFKLHELVAEMAVEGKARHRVRPLLSELTDEGVVEKAEGARYRLVGWVPELPPVPPAVQHARAAVHKSPVAGGAAARVGASAASQQDGRPPPPPGTVAGTIRVHPAGYGFVVREDGEDDAFVAARNRSNAMDGDRVAIAIWPGHKGTEGRVVEVLQRGRAKITGTLQASTGRTYWLEPDDPRILGHVALDGEAGAGREGEAVVAEIIEYPTEPEGPMTARVLKVLGPPDDPRTEVAKIIACADIPDEFPDDVRLAGERTPTEVREIDTADRVDLRDRKFMTIDPVTARDFDDAICVEDGPRPGLDRLWVAVADVSHYVRLGQPVDKEAQIRGVSVYLPDRAIPMLPVQLSSGICSLNPDVDRLAMVARMDVDEKGAIVDEHLMAAVIRSRARLDYEGTAAALAGDFRGQRARYREHLPDLQRLQKVSHRLRAVRRERGSLDFDLPEAKVVLDEDDPTRVRTVVKSRALPEVKEAYRIVEDCMIAANEAVGRFFERRNLDTLWRVHDKPKEERLAEFSSIAESFGVPFVAEDGRSPRKVRDFLERIAGKPIERALSYLLLRTLKQAVYDVTNVGHFGLASPAYLHFTSPIRRYPDLVVHRLVKRQLRAEGLPSGGGEAYAGPKATPREELVRWAIECSQHERRAMEAEREVVDMYRAYLMRDRVGEEYEGTIAGVVHFGLFVEITDPFVEGLVKLESLKGDRYVFDEKTVRLVAQQSGHAFALGDTVRVVIENVSVQRRKIDMALVDHVETAPRRVPSHVAPSRGQAKRRFEEARGKPEHGKERGKARGTSRGPAGSTKRGRADEGPKRGGRGEEKRGRRR